MQVAGNQLFFRSGDAPSGKQRLWKTDGTAAGTEPVAAATANPIAVFELTTLGNQVVFFARPSAPTGELWISDGTDLGTTKLRTYSTGGFIPSPSNLHANPNETEAYMSFFDLPTGSELWKTDGTVAGTVMVKDINPGAASSNPGQLTNWNGKTYFTAESGSLGQEIWVTDGTTAGTQLLKDISPITTTKRPDLERSAVFNGELYFNASDTLFGKELWKTDGTTAGTVLAADGLPGFWGSNPVDLVVAGNYLFFHAVLDTAHGRELCTLDGSGVVSRVLDLWPGTENGLTIHNSHITKVGNRVCFSASDQTSGQELWISDGTAAGTHAIKDIHAGPLPSNPEWLTPIGSSLLFVAEDATAGRELWFSDLTDAGTQVLADIEPAYLGEGSDPRFLSSMDGQQLYFWARDGTNKYSSWAPYVWNGSNPPTQLLPPPFYSVSFNVNPGFYSAFLGGKQITFFAADVPHHYQLWATDGTQGGTHMLLEVKEEWPGVLPKKFVQMGDALYFSYGGESSWPSLWRTDGTAPGTTEVYAPATLRTDSGHGFVEFKGRLYLPAEVGSSGVELWTSDGTKAGTHVVIDLTVGQNFSSNVDHLFVYHDLLFFQADDGIVGNEFWSSDGTAAGTTLVSDLDPGGKDSFPEVLGTAGGLMILSAKTSANGRELFVSDGTPAGTQPLPEIWPGSNDGVPLGNDHFVFEDKLYFEANDGIHGLELWTTDGTAAGTHLMIDLNLGGLPSKFHDAVNANGGFYFSATNGGVGNQLWFSDGTAAGTTVVCSVGTIPGVSWDPTQHLSPSELTLMQGNLVFVAGDSSLGRELYMLPTPGAYAANLGPDNTNSDTLILSASDPILGGNFTVACQNIAPGSFNVLAMSAPVASPSAFLSTADDASWIDPATATPLAFFGAVDWSLSLALPLAPSLVGVEVNLQNYALPGGQFPALTSNGLRLSIGN